MEKKPNASDQDFIFENYCIPMKPYKLYIDKAPTCKKLKVETLFPLKWITLFKHYLYNYYYDFECPKLSSLIIYKRVDLLREIILKDNRGKD